MEVYVNNEPLDFSLDKAVPLSNVLGHVQDWAIKDNFYIIDYQVDSKTESHQDMLTSEIDAIKIQLGNQQELILHNLSELDHYIDRMGTFIASLLQSNETMKADESGKILDGLSWISESLESIAGQSGQKDNEEFLICIKALAELNKDNINSIDSIEQLSRVKNLIVLWSNRVRISTLSEEDLKNWNIEFKKDIPLLLTKLNEVAENLTVGKEALAIITLEFIVAKLSDAISILSKNEENKKFCDKLMSLLDELTTSLTNNDMVTSADLVDFDLKELLESY